MIGLKGFDDAVARIAGLPGRRVLVAVVGPPGAGKSTLADALAAALNGIEADSAAVVPMDGFHYDDAVLRARGQLARKGAPVTFDVDGLRHLLRRLAAADEAEVAIPVFDRALELSRAAARIVTARARVLIVEGNYLLLRDAPWSGLSGLFDLSVSIDEPRDVLEQRLIARWLGFGLSAESARRRVMENDLPNVDLVNGRSRPADIVLRAAHPAIDTCPRHPRG
jgi:pantothenate kinase